MSHLLNSNRSKIKILLLYILICSIFFFISKFVNIYLVENIVYFDTLKLYLPFAKYSSFPISISSSDGIQHFFMVIGVLPFFLAFLLSNLDTVLIYFILLLIFIGSSFYFFKKIIPSSISFFVFLFFLIVVDIIGLELPGFLRMNFNLDGPLFLRFPNSLVSNLWIIGFYCGYKNRNTKLVSLFGSTGLFVNVYIGLPLALGAGIYLLSKKRLNLLLALTAVVTLILTIHFGQIIYLDNTIFQEYLGLKKSERIWLILLYFILAIWMTFKRLYWVAWIFVALGLGRSAPFVLGYSVQPFHWERDFAVPALIIFMFDIFWKNLSRRLGTFLSIGFILIYFGWVILSSLSSTRNEPYAVKGQKYNFGVTGFGWTTKYEPFIPAPPFTLDSTNTIILRWASLACDEDEYKKISNFLKTKYGYYSVYYFKDIYKKKILNLSKEDWSFFNKAVKLCQKDLIQLNTQERFLKLKARLL